MITNVDIYAVLLLAKKSQFTRFLVCKIFGPKIRSRKIFDKFQVCNYCCHHHYCLLYHDDDDQGTFSDSEDDGVGGNVYQRQGFIIKTPNLKYDQWIVDVAA